MVILGKDLLDLVPDNIPSMLSYATFANKKFMYNTSPCFAIYTIQLVLKWIEETVGGLEKMDVRNKEKAGMLYDFIDNSSFYNATADIGSRSLMNVTFRLLDEDLEKSFVADVIEKGLGGLKGHISVGGCEHLSIIRQVLML